MVDTLREFVGPVRPRWACELSSAHVSVAGADRSRSRILGKSSSELPAGAIVPSLVETNVSNPQAVSAALRQALSAAGFRGTEIVLVIPDEATRIAVMNLEAWPKDPGEQHSLVRWKFKKTVPFDVESAQVDFAIIGRGKSVDLLATVSPRSVIREYEALVESLDLDPGCVIPSTLAAMRLLGTNVGDTLFLKRSDDGVSTSIFAEGRLRFYRRVASVPLYDAVFPTMMYYMDKLGGQALKHMVVCGFETAFAEIRQLAEQLQMTVRPMEPGGVSDLWKPALGAAGIVWEAK